MATKYVIYTGLPKTMTEDQILAMKTELEGIRDGIRAGPYLRPGGQHSVHHFDLQSSAPNGYD
jgi:hypothetical protein